MEVPTAFTTNSAISHSSTGIARLNLFFRATRDLTSDRFFEYLKAAWEESPLDTLKLIFHLRDCRGGKGEKQLFRLSLEWLLLHHRAALKANLKHIPEFGYYKDLLFLFDTEVEIDMLKILSSRLLEDKERLSANDYKSVSLAAKWAPTENCHFDKKFDAVNKLCRVLKMNKAFYRKFLITPLRRHLKIVEAQMCAGKWEDIDFSRVPSVAFKRYSKLFKEHTPALFDAFLQKVKEGKAKINTARLQPHEIVSTYIAKLHDEVDETIEMQWKQFILQLETRMQLENAIAVVDVSGSMSGRPLEVAVSLGMVLAELTTGPFHNKWITFSAKPQLESLEGETLLERVQNMIKSNWGMNTNIQAVFELILNFATSFSCTQEQLPKTIFIFSDMQFDTACKDNKKTNFEVIEEKFTKAGYKMPRLVFWNINATGVDFPVLADTPNVALVSGFSPDLMELFLDRNELSPYGFMRKAIDAERYNCITLDE